MRILMVEDEDEDDGDTCPAGPRRRARMNRRSLALQLGAWYTLLLSVAFVLVGTGIFYGLQHYLRSNMRDSLRRRSMEVAQILIGTPVNAPDSTIAREIELRLAPEVNNRFVRVTRAPGKVILLSGPPSDRSFNRFAVSARVASETAKSAGAFTAAILDGQHLMVSSAPIGSPSGQYVVEMGASTVPMESVLDRLIDLLAVLLPLLIACAAGGGYFLVRWALRP